MKSPFFIRMARLSDVAACRAIDVEAWGEDMAASEEMLRSRIERYPCGNFVAIDRDTGDIVGSAWTLAIADKLVTTWWECSGEGEYRSCDPHGDIIFGVNLAAKPAHEERGAGAALTVRVAEMAWLLGKRRSVFGARLPQYHLWAPVFAAEDYIRMRKARSTGSLYFTDVASGRIHAVRENAIAPGAGFLLPRVDPRGWPVVAALPLDASPLDGFLAYFMGIPVRGQPCRIYKLLPEYFADPDSCNYGVLIGWENDQHPNQTPWNP